MDDVSDRPAAQERLPVSEHRRLESRGRRVRTALLLQHPPNLDFTAQPVYYAKRGVDLAGELRYLTARQRGTLDFNYLPNDDAYDPDGDAPHDRWRVVLNHVAELPGEWRFRIDATE